MEENQQVEVINNQKNEFKKFQVSFLLFLIGEIFLVVSQASHLTSINGVPQALVLLQLLSTVGYVFYFIAIFRIREINKAFMRSLIALAVLLVLFYVRDLSSNSIQPVDRYIGKGLGWSASFVECTFYLYFFYGTHLIFNKYGYSKGAKNLRISLAVFAGLFLVTRVFEYLSTARFIRINRFTNRFFLYGYWSLIFLVYLFILTIIVLTWIYLKLQFNKKKGESHETA